MVSASRPRSIIAAAALALGALAILTACQPPRYNITLCQAKERIGFVASSDGWFNNEAELSDISFFHEVPPTFSDNPPTESKTTALWRVEAPGNYQDTSKRIRGNLFFIGDVPKGWSEPVRGGPFTITNDSLTRGENYSVIVSGGMSGDAFFVFGEDILPYCDAVLKAL